MTATTTPASATRPGEVGGWADAGKKDAFPIFLKVAMHQKNAA